MPEFVLQRIYSKQDNLIPQYLEVIFNTNLGMFKVGYGQFSSITEIDVLNYHEDSLDELKDQYGTLAIEEARVDYDQSMFFLICNKFLLVLGYEPNTYSYISSQKIWIETDIYGSNNAALEDFFTMERLTLPV